MSILSENMARILADRIKLRARSDLQVVNELFDKGISNESRGYFERLDNEGQMFARLLVIEVVCELREEWRHGADFIAHDGCSCPLLTESQKIP